MALGVVACWLPGRVERGSCRAHGRAVPDAARARVLVALLRAHRTVTMREPSALTASTAARRRLPRRRWRGRGGLVWKVAELATSAGSLTAAPQPPSHWAVGSLSGSPRVRGAVRGTKRQPQEGRVMRRGATRLALPTWCGDLQDPLVLQTVLRCEALGMIPSQAAL